MKALVELQERLGATTQEITRLEAFVIEHPDASAFRSGLLSVYNMRAGVEDRLAALAAEMDSCTCVLRLLPQA